MWDTEDVHTEDIYVVDYSSAVKRMKQRYLQKYRWA